MNVRKERKKGGKGGRKTWRHNKKIIANNEQEITWSLDGKKRTGMSEMRENGSYDPSFLNTGACLVYPLLSDLVAVVIVSGVSYLFICNCCCFFLVVGEKQENVTPCLILKKCELTWFLSLFIYDKKERRPMKTKGGGQRIPNAVTNSLSADTRQDVGIWGWGVEKKKKRFTDFIFSLLLLSTCL